MHPRRARGLTVHLQLAPEAEMAPIVTRMQRDFAGLPWAEPRRLVGRPRAQRLVGALPARSRCIAPPLDRHWSLRVEGHVPHHDVACIVEAARGLDEVAWGGALVPAESPSSAHTSTRATVERALPQAWHLHGRTPVGAGLDAWYAWRFAGGDGRRSQVVDVERGWHLDHEAIAEYRITLPGESVNHPAASHRAHGLGVLAIVGARDNTLGLTGIAPRLLGLHVASTVRVGVDPEQDDHVAALCEAWELVRGNRGIILLESQVQPLSAGGSPEFDRQLPAEVLPSVREVIWHAVESGTTVVAVAGNAPARGRGVGVDLGPWFPGRGLSGEEAANGRERPAADGIVDSGSILVGAVTSGPPHCWDLGTNFGRPVDCWAWTNNVVTATRSTATGADHRGLFGTRAGATSSAAAIVAGVAAVYRSVFEEHRDRPPTPAEIRTALHSRADPPDPSAAPPTSSPDPVQLMPNLRRVIETGLGLPYVWIRADLDDRGEPIRHRTSLSPDIIPWPSPLSASDARTRFGAGSAADAALLAGREPAIGERGQLVIRVHNRSASVHRGQVDVEVYETPLCTSPMTWEWGRPHRARIGPVPERSWAVGRVGLEYAGQPRSFTTVMGIAGDPPASRAELAAPGRLRWLQRRMRAVSVRSVARMNDSVRATTRAGVPIVALPVFVAGEPDRDSAARLRVGFTGAGPIRPCILLPPRSSILRTEARGDDVVAVAPLPRTLIWLDDSTEASWTSGLLSIPAATAVRIAIGFAGQRSQAAAFRSAEVVQTDGEGLEMGRVLWVE
jgi:hypothetical protein